MPTTPLSPQDLQATARQRLDPAVYDFCAGGADAEVTVRANEAAAHFEQVYAHPAANGRSCGAAPPGASSHCPSRTPSGWRPGAWRRCWTSKTSDGPPGCGCG